jgi:hypothetical protein
LTPRENTSRLSWQLKLLNLWIFALIAMPEGVTLGDEGHS